MADRDLRSVLLSVIADNIPRGATDGFLQTGVILDKAKQEIGGRLSIDEEQALLTQLHDLFRSGYLAWGANLANAAPPFCHVTTAGRRVLERVSRDPGNPEGYKAYVNSVAQVDPISFSYLDEGLLCYANGLYKASAVMVGGSAERLVLELRECVTKRLGELGQTVPKKLEDWRVKQILDGLQQFFSDRRTKLPVELRDEFEANWPAFAQQVRAVRNEAGHPANIDPVTEDTVHASLLIYPEIAKLQQKLRVWVADELS